MFAKVKLPQFISKPGQMAPGLKPGWLTVVLSIARLDRPDSCVQKICSKFDNFGAHFALSSAIYAI